jgi:hypothetical protein
MHNIEPVVCTKSARPHCKISSPMAPIAPLVSILLLLLATAAGAAGQEPHASPAIATGTLNLVVANKNGFVVLADSRMSADQMFPCYGRLQTHCDNSQKLFRTTPHSAMMIAGFAAGRRNSPLDLEIASVIRKQFAESRWNKDEYAFGVPLEAEGLLEDALKDVASISDPVKTPPQNLSLWATFVRLDKDQIPIIEVKIFVEQWKPTGPQQALIPEYTVVSNSAKATEFLSYSAGVTCIADAIFSGHYSTTNPVIRSFYEKRLDKAILSTMPLDDMIALATAIMTETEKFTDVVGGDNQIGVFPADGGNVRWSAPANLPSVAQLQPRTLRWEGITCSNASDPPCGVTPVSFMISTEQRHDETFKKFFLASQFLQIPVAVDNNFFVGNTFDHATLRWRGGSFFMYRNTFKDCVIEIPSGMELPSDSELEGKCRIERKTNIDIYTVVGARPDMYASPSGFGLPQIVP